jgi:hypothetical protein
MKPRMPGGRTMRVATAVTGVTAAAAGFLPTAAAHAATAPAGKPAKTAEFKGGKLVRLKVDPGPGTAGPDNTAPGQPYWLNLVLKSSVHSYQVCGWHPTNTWRCTAWAAPNGFDSATTVGGNKHSWDRGVIDIYWNGGGAGHWDYCDTNGSYYGSVQLGRSGLDGAESVWLYAPGGGGIGDGVGRC